MKAYKRGKSWMARWIRKLVIWYIGFLPKVFSFRKQVNPEILRLGSEYGGWDLNLDLMSQDKQISVISGGAGEDISFEIELLSKFNCKVVLIDPTERSRLHLSEVYESLGSYGQHDKAIDGLQPVASYDLRRVNPGNLEFLNVALWSNSHGLRLAPPAVEKHVSFKLPRSKRELLTATLFETTTIDEVMRNHFRGVDQGTCLIVKLDIEGSEIEVLKNMVSKSIQPCQILVEFDILRSATISDYFQCIALMTRLVFLGYIPVSIRGLCVSFSKRRASCNQ